MAACVALIAVLFLAFGDWVAVARGWRSLEYIFKPATMLAILIGTWLLTRGSRCDWQTRCFLAGFGLSLVGDIFLMLRRPKAFLIGLVAFLLAHLSYIAGFNAGMPPWPAFLTLIPIVGVGVVLLRNFAEGLRRQGEESMLVPITVYSVVLSGMLFSAWATLFRPSWTSLRRSLGVVGATAFFISDALLAWDRFVASLPLARLWIHVTYHLGQTMLAASVILAG